MHQTFLQIKHMVWHLYCVSKNMWLHRRR